MRILVIDDEPAMHEAYRRTFEARQAERGEADLALLAAELFGGDERADALPFDPVGDHNAPALGPPSFQYIELVNVHIELADRFLAQSKIKHEKWRSATKVARPCHFIFQPEGCSR